MKEEFVVRHFLVWKFLRKMKVGERKYIPMHLCAYDRVKDACNQLKRKNEGKWHITKKLVSEQGTIRWVEGTWVTREK